MENGTAKDFMLMVVVGCGRFSFHTSVHPRTLFETQRIRAAIYRISLVKKFYTDLYEFLRISDDISKQDQKNGSYILNRKVGEKPEQVHR